MAHHDATRSCEHSSGATYPALTPYTLIFWPICIESTGRKRPKSPTPEEIGQKLMRSAALFSR